jgi:hypothetical protein
LTLSAKLVETGLLRVQICSSFGEIPTKRQENTRLAESKQLRARIPCIKSGKCPSGAWNNIKHKILTL